MTTVNNFELRKENLEDLFANYAYHKREAERLYKLYNEEAAELRFDMLLKEYGDDELLYNMNGTYVRVKLNRPADDPVFVIVVATNTSSEYSARLTDLYTKDLKSINRPDYMPEI